VRLSIAHAEVVRQGGPEEFPQPGLFSSAGLIEEMRDLFKHLHVVVGGGIIAALGYELVGAPRQPVAEPADR